MNNLRNIFLYLFAALSCVGMLVSCDIEFEHEVCDHNAEIIYWYDAEMTLNENKLSDVVSTLDEYIFDADGILYGWRRVEVDDCYGGFSSTNNLPAGRYSVITWGNRSGINSPGDIQIGVTRREQMLLSAENSYSGRNPVNLPSGNPLQNNGDRLYYSYRTLTVPETGKASVRAQLVHGHLALRYRIRWRGNAPENTRDFHADLDSISSRYGCMPEYRYWGNTCRNHNPDDDDYRQVCSENRHYIKTVFDNRTYRHRTDVDMNSDRQVFGEFITYRLRNNTPATISLWSSGTATRTGEPKQLMKDIDLGGWFREKNIELDQNLKQDFYLDFEILEDGRVLISEMEISDWSEGGYLGF